MSSSLRAVVVLACVCCHAALEVRAGAGSAQPEYARPHTHQWEKAKTALINGALEIDGIFKEAKAALGAGSPVMQAVLNRRCTPEKNVDADGTFLIDNSQLKATTNGLGYRFTP